MSKEKETLTIKQRMESLSVNDRVAIRDRFLAKFEYGYPSWYQKINANNFKKLEREHIEQEITKVESDKSPNN
ncbi:hypothetical protein [Dysgonomonas macrotermitis]|uniref:Uncharacterized protein n=1 Tax=Dysgonomonas macrotermitis TaxID=1346286 RepID=A0A1M4UPE3_9BACT|nr:hypothetical protein [Dysgonomonas macrotermitis]SHE58569.1 hypothetical protein SAMN05444362_101660 [Dysgonomonas macrotermitis]